MNNRKTINILITIIIIIIIMISIIGIIITRLKNSKEGPSNMQQGIDTGKAILEPEYTASRMNNSGMMFSTISKCIKDTFKLNYNLYVWDLYGINRVSTETYFAHIITNKKESQYVAINIDHNTGAYNIESISNSDYEDIEKGKVPQKYINDVTVEKKENNNIKYANLNDEQITQYYMDMINDLLINYPEVIYKRLAEDYKEAKFKTYGEFEKYCNDRADFIRNKQYMAYASGVSNGNKIYKAKDMNENIYIIEEIPAGGFNIYLDDYTIDTDEFKEIYKKEKNEVKATTNAEKFLKMVNNRDYSAAYSLLNESYKNTNFPTEASYKEYLIKEFYPTNLIRSTQVKTRRRLLYSDN